ncbi:hypothetical protein SNEBB_003720 [Seison nebaliae]|nr:hypothetical protein SNEBB_003720 [Seison nebaliae]
MLRARRDCERVIGFTFCNKFLFSLPRSNGAYDLEYFIVHDRSGSYEEDSGVRSYRGRDGSFDDVKRSKEDRSYRHRTSRDDKSPRHHRNDDYRNHRPSPIRYNRDRRNRSPDYRRNHGDRSPYEYRHRHSPPDSRRRYHDDEGFRLHIGDLAADIDKKRLEKDFKRFGTITEVWVAEHPPCFAIVVYQERVEAEEAIREMNGKYLSDSRIRVTWARPRTRGRRVNRWDPNSKCYHCGSTGHFARDCQREKDRRMKFRDNDQSTRAGWHR